MANRIIFFLLSLYGNQSFFILNLLFEYLEYKWVVSKFSIILFTNSSIVPRSTCKVPFLKILLYHSFYQIWSMPKIIWIPLMMLYINQISCLLISSASDRKQITSLAMISDQHEFLLLYDKICMLMLKVHFHKMLNIIWRTIWYNN